MTIKFLPSRAAAILACVTSILAQQLPYNPTYLIQTPNSQVYIFSSASSPQFAAYDITNSIDSSVAPEALTAELPFLSNKTISFIPIATRNGLTVFSGECSQDDQELDLWTYGFGVNNKTWTQIQTTTSSGSAVGANFLSAAFSFPVADDEDLDSIYVFGGMCPDSTGNSSTWATDATYSNTMLTISPESSRNYDVSLTGQRAAPIAEAGLTITPLPQTGTQNGNGSIQQQNFVLIGGHTQSAFINMSQAAMFSMPQQSWAFIDIEQPADTVVEPRSGHTSVMSEDGSRIYVFGGWVGGVNNPAMPQLAVLEVGAGYGGNTSSWSWSVPDQSTVDQYTGESGVYGHAATMLPGDIMMVTGGYSISSQTQGQRKRQQATLSTKFFNISSLAWDSSYTNPVTLAATRHSKSATNSSKKIGLGAGLGIGIAAVLLIVGAWLIYARRRRQRRAVREKQLREMALGTDRAFSADLTPTKAITRSGFSGYRSASWGSRQEQSIEGTGSYPSCRQVMPEDVAYENGRVNLSDVPNPTYGLKSSLRGRGPASFGSAAYHGSVASGAVFTIQEEEERSQRGSIRRPTTANSRPLSDPFKDPPATNPQPDPAAESRRQEVATWVEDWASAAESMNVERSASKAHSRTYSNLSTYHSASSGDKSDRTDSNLSERSNVSMFSTQKSHTGTLSRTFSQRSGSAGYALFSSAAAAMSRITGRQDHGNLDRNPSKRSISTGDLAQMKIRKRGDSMEQSHPIPLPITNALTPRDEASGNDYFTPPESPIKDYKNHTRRRSNSLTNQSIKAFGALSSATKRVLTGTGSVSVSNKVEKIENRSSPSKRGERPVPEMSEVQRGQRATSSGATFWKHKQGAKDWEDAQLEGSSGTIRRRSSRVRLESDPDEYTDDWDVETAIQQRVVQVMFTVPKEKLRVVNADNISMISRSDTNASRDSDKNEDGREINRMSRVTEAGELEVEDGSTLVGGISGSSLHPDSALDVKGKSRMMDREASGASGASGATIGKAL